MNLEPIIYNPILDLGIGLLFFLVYKTFPFKSSKKEKENPSKEQINNRPNSSNQWYNNYRTDKNKILKGYDLYFYWKPLESWVLLKKNIVKDTEIFKWFDVENDKNGVLIFDSSDQLKKIFYIFMKQYSKSGELNKTELINEFSDSDLKNILSDVVFKELYINREEIKITFPYFNTFHNTNQYKNISLDKEIIISAMKYFGFNKTPTFEEVKIAYKKQAMIYHPDRPNGSIERMQIINSQFEILKEYFKG